MMKRTTVLISGAGIAGPTLAYWLERYGFEPTLVEKAEDFRSSGNPVDIRGPALKVVEKMDLMASLRAHATQTENLHFHDAKGCSVARLPAPTSPGASGLPEIEILRADLAMLLKEATSEVELISGDSITALQQDATGVEVTFKTHPARRFDLVIGADGLHSNVRKLAFGSEDDFVHYMGAYAATFTLPGPGYMSLNTVELYNAPSRLLAVHPARGHPTIGFFFRHPLISRKLKLQEQKALIVQQFHGMSGPVPDYLEQLHLSSQLYFDSVSAVRLPTWSQGRVALLGDAASCLSLFGEGSSLAIAGAYTLAWYLKARQSNFAAALHEYESLHRALVRQKVRRFRPMSSFLIPAGPIGLALRDQGLRFIHKLHLA